MIAGIKFEQYSEMVKADREVFLRDYIEEQKDLSEQFLLEVLRFESNPWAKWYAIKGLGLLKSQAGIPIIIEICKTPDVILTHTSLHSICAWSLGRIGEAAFLPVMGLLGEETVETRKCAVDALGELRHPRAIEALSSSLANDLYDVKLWAGLSLAKIGNDSIAVLSQLINSADQRTRLIVLDAILRIDSNESIPIIKNLLDNGTSQDKRLIQEAAFAPHYVLLKKIEFIATSNAIQNELKTMAQSILAQLRVPAQ